VRYGASWGWGYCPPSAALPSSDYACGVQSKLRPAKIWRPFSTREGLRISLAWWWIWRLDDAGIIYKLQGGALPIDCSQRRMARRSVHAPMTPISRARETSSEIMQMTRQARTVMPRSKTRKDRSLTTPSPAGASIKCLVTLWKLTGFCRRDVIAPENICLAGNTRTYGSLGFFCRRSVGVAAIKIN